MNDKFPNLSDETTSMDAISQEEFYKTTIKILENAVSSLGGNIADVCFAVVQVVNSEWSKKKNRRLRTETRQLLNLSGFHYFQVNGVFEEAISKAKSHNSSPAIYNRFIEDGIGLVLNHPDKFFVIAAPVHDETRLKNVAFGLGLLYERDRVVFRYASGKAVTISLKDSPSSGSVTNEKSFPCSLDARGLFDASISIFHSGQFVFQKIHELKQYRAEGVAHMLQEGFRTVCENDTNPVRKWLSRDYVSLDPAAICRKIEKVEKNLQKLKRLVKLTD